MGWFGAVLSELSEISNISESSVLTLLNSYLRVKTEIKTRHEVH